MKKFYEYLRERTVEITNFKKMKLLTNKQQKSYRNAKICYICKDKFEDKHVIKIKIKNIVKLGTTLIILGNIAVHSVCNIKFRVDKEISTFFHNGSNYDYLFIIKKLAEEFEKQFPCLGENTEKYITFSVPIEKEVTRIDEKGNEITRTISCRL